MLVAVWNDKINTLLLVELLSYVELVLQHRSSECCEDIFIETLL